MNLDRGPAQAERIAVKLVPDDFCGPSSSIGGCDLVTENFYDSWRIFVNAVSGSWTDTN